ncbi:PREDICTED: uncharacterized protein LOC105461802 [Wasmannia auropunctata]|nr:PREDICTED: uncharacterized protein LOC105458665 isoform X2 [Wasmannia auropunctata]XP_011702453.1 PREDICTED: uncharacterized protein LOC105458665 isoform X2 [Wasmannia auropunctata]XP_011706606.1 PREDICTED: uncharacterized protein LOC105461802 [Wasmannia auropunctata]
MTKDYAKARDVGDRLLKRNRDDADVGRALNILQHIKKREERERSSLIESDDVRVGSDATDGDDTNFVDDNADARIDLGMADRIASPGTSRLSKTSDELKQRMYRVIAVRVSREELKQK